jgi:hypothetical protein
MSSCGDDWTTQDGMNEYNISDDGRVEIDLPFTFPFQGNNYVKSWMYSNGVVGFMSNSAHFCCNGIDVANGDFTNYTGLPYFSYSIAALWTDLRDYNVDVDGDGVNDTGFFTQEVDTNNNGQTDTLRYLWRNISEYGRSNNVNTFGTEINSSGGIEIHHFDINITNHAVTVGVFGDVRNSSEIEQYEYYSYNQDFIDDTYSVYTFNLTGACQANPLISTLCDGYAEAYATLIYNQSCAADALYDVGCPGYASAYYDQQCSLNQLYDSGCPFYAEAYYDQQCSLDPLYDSGCTGYASAYYDQQCSLDPLYDSGCTGYDQAYYEEYVEPTLQQANETAGVEDETTVTNNDVNEDIEFASNPVETITSVEVTGDATVDQILRDNTVSNPVDVIVEMPPLEIEPVVEEPIQESIVVTENESSTEESEIIEIAEIEESIDEEFGTEVGSEESTDEEQIEEVAENEEVVEEVAQNEEVVEETSENSEEGANDNASKEKGSKTKEIKKG